MKFSTLLLHITPRRGTLALIVALLLASSAVALANPWIAGRLTQSILEPASSTMSLRFILLAWLGLLFLRSVLNFATQYLVGITGQKMSTELRVRSYDHLQILPLEYFQARKSGDLLALLTKDAEYISTFITETLVQLLPLLLTFFGAMVIMAWLDPVIALLAAVLLPVYYLAMKIIGRRIRPLTRQWIDKWSAMVALMQENLGLVPAIKAFGREPLELQRFTANNSELLGLARKQVFIHAVSRPPSHSLPGRACCCCCGWVSAHSKRSTRRSGVSQPAALRHAADATDFRPGRCLRASHADSRCGRAPAGFLCSQPRTAGQRRSAPGHQAGQD